MKLSNDLYNPGTGRWTPAGQTYIRKILKKNPKPSKEQRKEIMTLTGISREQLWVSANKNKELQIFFCYFSKKSTTSRERARSIRTKKFHFHQIQ
jgi:hypothetical protein